ncbi:hypothetical protein MMC11_006308 [Xylographa trunciseda]|nr:hypothetical protein [Xylographa trunciseda]
MNPHPSPPTLEASDSDPPSDHDPDLATQMGFASFGAQPTAKRRKYNPAADAMTSFLPAAHTGLPQKPPPALGTGANSGVLGRARGGKDGWLSDRGHRGAHVGDRHAEGEGAMRKDRVLGGGGRRGRGGRGPVEKRWMNAEGPSGSNSMPLGTRVGSGGENGASKAPGIGLYPRSKVWETEEEEDDGMPGYVDSTPPGSPLRQETIHPTGEVEGSPIHEERASVGRLGEEAEEGVDADAASETVGHPTASSGILEKLSVRTQKIGGHYDWNALRKGIRNEQGDVAYYDASFVEDPWRDLVGG